MRTNGEKFIDFIEDHPLFYTITIFAIVIIVTVTCVNWWNNNVCTIDNNPQDSSQNTSQSQTEQLPSETIQNDSGSQNNDKESISEDGYEPLFKIISAEYYTGEGHRIFLEVIEDTQTGTQYIITSQGGICKREGL